MATIIDYKAKEPRKRFNLSAARRIPTSPTRLILSTITLNTGMRKDRDNNRVELVATVGVRGVTGISQLRFRLFRNGLQIYTTQTGVESIGSERNYVMTFQAIDRNVSGFHTYTLTVENVAMGTAANLVGPLSFSGLSIRTTK